MFLIKFILALFMVVLCFEVAKHLSGFHYHIWRLYSAWSDPDLILVTEWRTTISFSFYFLASLCFVAFALR